MSFIALVPSFYSNARSYQAVCDGVTDDTTFLQNAINALPSNGGTVILPGLCAISSPLTLSVHNTHLMGAGPGTGLKALAGFSGAELVSITADTCGVRDMELLGGPNTSSSSNPATNGIEVSAARYALLKNLQMSYINGWAIESIGGSSVNNVGSVMDAIHLEHCAKGIHLKGVSGSNYVGQMFLSAIHPEAIDNGDALFLEDINDIEIVNFNGAVIGGAVSGSMLHIKGACASHFYSNIDLGQLSQGTASPTVLIETSSNGSPSNIVVDGGIVQKGSQNLLVTDGSNILFRGVTFKSPNTDNVAISGATVATPLVLENCVFQTGNQSNGTAYDVNLTHSTGFSYIRSCSFMSPVGSGAGNVTNPANDTNHRGYFINSHFAGSNTTPSTCFSSGTPQIVRGCPGYNPRGSITAGTIGASPATGNSSQNDITVIFTAINGMTTFKIGGTSIGVVPVAGNGYRIPARQTWEIDWAGSAPTWVWIAD